MTLDNPPADQLGPHEIPPPCVQLRPAGPTALLCDVDGTLFASEEPAFEASAVITREFANRYGLDGDFSARSLRLGSTGRNFRGTATELLRRAGLVPDAEFGSWVECERVAVTARLCAELTPNAEVTASLRTLARHYRLAAVSSSAAERLAGSLAAAGLTDLFPTDVRFSAENSLPVPVSKPDPAVYLAALAALGLHRDEAVAVEDAVAGVQSAVGAGIVTVGMLAFVGEDERPARRRDLLAAGAEHVVDSWPDLVTLLSSRRARPTAAPRHVLGRA